MTAAIGGPDGLPKALQKGLVPVIEAYRVWVGARPACAHPLVVQDFLLRYFKDRLTQLVGPRLAILSATGKPEINLLNQRFPIGRPAGFRWGIRLERAGRLKAGLYQKPDTLKVAKQELALALHPCLEAGEQMLDVLRGAGQKRRHLAYR